MEFPISVKQISSPAGLERAMEEAEPDLVVIYHEDYVVDMYSITDWIDTRAPILIWGPDDNDKIVELSVARMVAKLRRCGMRARHQPFGAAALWLIGEWCAGKEWR